MPERDVNRSPHVRHDQFFRHDRLGEYILILSASGALVAVVIMAMADQNAAVGIVSIVSVAVFYGIIAWKNVRLAAAEARYQEAIRANRVRVAAAVTDLMVHRVEHLNSIRRVSDPAEQARIDADRRAVIEEVVAIMRQFEPSSDDRLDLQTPYPPPGRTIRP